MELKSVRLEIPEGGNKFHLRDRVDDSFVDVLYRLDNEVRLPGDERSNSASGEDLSSVLLFSESTHRLNRGCAARRNPTGKEAYAGHDERRGRVDLCVSGA